MIQREEFKVMLYRKLLHLTSFATQNPDGKAVEMIMFIKFHMHLPLKEFMEY
ncbi:hypothetical protein SAMN06273570_3723 [Candidatus Pantoea floridensis]|uniref:Uncharacterized protein n=1 Tax=Candidatus Pantoea floridensis TaxID=1938870 RepID=A0A286BYQ2_9GAMM|nr:hypothetical protein BX596_1171 [Enterobacteriaceae bacterium JKS000233]SOD39280.1 hypothetical protein SAMN06273570_3723 [Pantoea floridensis]